MENFAWLIPALPLFGFLFSIFLGSKLPKNVVASVASLAVLLPLILTGSIFIPFISAVDAEPIRILLGEWIHIGKLSVNYSFQLDQLSLMMMLVITGVGFLIHVYSAGYMHDDPGFSRFFSYLNLFIFFMFLIIFFNSFSSCFLFVYVYYII
jgi:NADH-quinone oxidoreductase subunit L